MTSEQIAEMRDWVADPAAGGMVPIQAQRLTKLLDEREALLEALKHATDAIAGEWGDSSAEDLRAVIAKAEAP